MKYYQPALFTNTYPKPENYVPKPDGNSSLLGNYPTINKVDFTIPDITKIKVVDGTTFSSIVAVYKDATDNSPKYYTSLAYSLDLKLSKFQSNPYYINYSFQNQSIIKIYLKDIIQSVSTLREKELELGVAFVRNNFILYNTSGFVVESKTETVTINNTANQASANLNSTIQKEIDDTNNKIAIYENALNRADRDIQLKRGFLYGPKKRKAEYTVDNVLYESLPGNWNASDNRQRQDIKDQLSQKITEYKDYKAKLESNLISTNTQNEKPKTTTIEFAPTKKIKLDPNKIDKDIKKVLDKVVGADEWDDIIEMDGVFIDCIHLMKYIDWILSKPTFEEIENGGVIKAEDLTVFKVKDDLPVIIDTDNPRNKNLPQGNENNGPKKYSNYRVIRLSIPASLEDSSMTYLDSFGIRQEIRTDQYGEIGTFCVEEGTFGGRTELYQRIQGEPCNIQNDTGGGTRSGGGNGGVGGGGRGGGGGSRDSYYIREQNSNIQYIDYNRDRANLE